MTTTLVSPTERVKAWTEGPALHIRFNNPAKHNALSVDMWEAVPILLAKAEACSASPRSKPCKLSHRTPRHEFLHHRQRFSRLIQPPRGNRKPAP